MFCRGNIGVEILGMGWGFFVFYYLNEIQEWRDCYLLYCLINGFLYIGFELFFGVELQVMGFIIM